jgi:hypothetical protein
MVERAASHIATGFPETNIDQSAGQNLVVDDQTELLPLAMPLPEGGLLVNAEPISNGDLPMEGDSRGEAPEKTSSSSERSSLFDAQSPGETPLLEETQSPVAEQSVTPATELHSSASAVSGEKDPMSGDSKDESDATREVRKPGLQPGQFTPPVPEAPESGRTERADQTDNNPPSLTTQWKYVRVPDGPDKHDEFDQRAEVTSDKLKIIGARARGKKHKHEGTNCDDWFDFEASGEAGDWTIVAVSDGAGSKTFSRIGAKTSCETAVKELSGALQGFSLKVHADWTGEEKDKKGIFAEEDFARVGEALHSAMNKAYDAVAAKATELAAGEESELYSRQLNGRALTLDDLSGTLLLAVLTTVMHEEKERTFVMTCQIGDGMLAAVDRNGGLTLLGHPDSGEFAGQTDFLTSRKKLEKANLAGKTFSFFGPVQALMVMTDAAAVRRSGDQWDHPFSKA